MRPRLSLALLAVPAVLLAAAGCGGGGDPMRIGIITDCADSPFAFSRPAEIASAELPLIQRGARVPGSTQSNELDGASVGGRPVKLEIVCAESLNPKAVLAQLRRLVDSRHVDAVVGPTHEPDTILARYARRRKGIVFMLTSYDQPSTLRFATPNMFRFELDNAQLSAGLAGYAYHRLGWRDVTTVGEDDPPGWDGAAGFDAEFCSLGGHVRRVWAPGGAGHPKHWVRRALSAADGVFLAPGFYGKAGFERRWARGHDLSRRLVLGWYAKPSRRLQGVVAVSSWSWAMTPAFHRFDARFWKKFPNVRDPEAIRLTYYDEVEPLLEALKRVHGNTSNGERPLQKALARLHYASPEGRMRLDKRNQAIGPTYLGRIGGGTVHQVAVIHGVDETFGGYFTRNRVPPGPHSPACVKGKPPPWARPTR